MSHDPFQDLFDRGIPRSSTTSTTRATLDSLTPQFERAKSRRRARVSAIAAFAVLGTTGGAAALGVGPVARSSRPPVDFNNGLAGGNEAEAPVEPVDTTTTTTVTTTIPSTVSAFTIPTPSAESSSVVETTNDPATISRDTSGDSTDTSETEVSGAEGAGASTDGSSDGETSSSDNSSSTAAETPKDGDSPSDIPVAGPLTKSTDDGSVTVDIGTNGLLLVEVTPADSGISYQVDAKPDEISIEFRDTVTGDELSSLDFKLVDGGITVEVEASSS